jgi:hypothetical protein
MLTFMHIKGSAACAYISPCEPGLRNLRARAKEFKRVCFPGILSANFPGLNSRAGITLYKRHLRVHVNIGGFYSSSLSESFYSLTLFFLELARSEICLTGNDRRKLFQYSS